MSVESLEIIAQNLNLEVQNGTNQTLEITNGATLDLILGQMGLQGPAGPAGKSISSVVKTSTVGLVDTYTITFSDSTTQTFTVTNGTAGIDGVNGRGIVSITRTSGTGAAGTTDTYTITYTDSTTSTFTVYNGADGVSSGGTVTSVALTVPTGLSVANSPITTFGSLGITYQAGYSIPTTVKQGQWDTAYGWGNHALAGYLTNAAISNTVQAYDADLTAIAALAGTSGLLKKTAANTWELTESGGGGGSSNPATLTYTYTGVMTVPPVSLPGTTEGLFASPSGNERSYGVLLSSANYGLTGIEFTKLEFVLGTFSPSNMAALTSLSLPALTTVGGAFSPSNMAALTSLSLPALTTVGSTFNPGNMAALTSLSLPALTTVGGAFSPSNMAALTSLSLPAIERVGTSVTSGNAIQFNSSTGALVAFTLPATLKQVGGTVGNVSIVSAALNQASVDNILVRLAALDGTGGTVAFSSRTVTITGTSAAPSSTGLAAKDTLVARGCTVTHN